MKLRPVTKLGKKNKITSKNDDDVLSKHCNVVVFFYGQFGAIWKLDTGRIFCKTYIFINSIIYLIKTENRLKNLQQNSHTISFELRFPFCQKC